MKKIKSLFIGGAAFAASAIPMAAAISCGSDEKIDLTLGIRPDEVNLWQPVIEKFEKATGKNIDLVAVSNMTTNYQNWSGSNSIPDVTILDGGARADAEKSENKWFQDLDLGKIFTDAKYNVAGLTESALNVSTDFQEALMNNAKSADDSSKYDLYPAVIGPSALYFIKDYIKPSGSLHNYVVKDTEDVNTRVTEYKSSKDSADEVFKWATAEEGIKKAQEYINKAVLKANDPNQADLDNHWYSIGQIGMSQRIFSVAKDLFKDDTPGKKAALLGNADVSNGFISDGLIKPTGYDPYVKTDDITTLDDKKAYIAESTDPKGSKWTVGKPNTGAVPVDMTKASLKENKFMMQSYYGYLGYFNGKANKNAMSSDAAGVKDGQTAFAKGQFSLMRGAMWMMGGIKAKMKDNGISDSKLSAFSLPLGGAGADGYAVMKGLDSETDTLAKQFIKYIASPEANAAIGSTKVLSNNKEGQGIQIEKNKDSSLFKAFLSYGSAVSQATDKNILINKVASIYSSSSSDGINYPWFQATFADHKNKDEQKGKAVTLVNFLAQLNAGNKKYWENQKIARPTDWREKNPLLK